MNTQTKLTLAAIAGGMAIGFGGASVLGVPSTKQSGGDTAGGPAAIEELRALEAERDAFQEAMFETQDRLAALTRELEEAHAERDAMRAENALAAANGAMDDLEQLEAEMDEAMAEAGQPAFEPNAELRGPRGAPGEGQPRWDPERIAEMRAERDARIQGFFDDAFERAPSRESQERLAAIEAYSHDAMELMRGWRGAGEDEREALREQLGSMRAAMGDLIREEQDARVREAAARHGVTDAAQQQAIAESIREIQSDPIFRGGAWTGGRRGAPTPPWTGGRRGGGGSSR